MKQKSYGSGWVLFTALTIAASIAAPRPLLAGSPDLKNRMSPRAQQNSEPKGGQQSPPSRPPQSEINGSGGGNHSRPPRNGSSPERPEPRPNPTQPRPGGPVGAHPETPGPRPAHPPTQGRPPVRPSPRPPLYHHPTLGPRPGYGWGSNGWRLHQFFLGGRHRLPPTRRRHFYGGEYFPLTDLPYMQPVPPQVLEHLPPIPPGYDIGYYEGYGLVYDPNTLLIISVIDLYRY